ncbi:MAG: hypothetical protein J5I92_01170, partial [Thiogranum sp.]|nr:hypothetical protein [Thiogranum sp.]
MLLSRLKLEERSFFRLLLFFSGEDSHMIKHTFLVTLLTCFAAASTFAAEAPDASATRFHSLDTNKDGHVSLFEARDRHRVFHYYQKADTNVDGHLDRAEFSAFEAEVPDYEMHMQDR